MSSSGHQTNNSSNFDDSLSPVKGLRDRSSSRPSSRNSIRTHSPSFSLDDPVAVRNQMSTLKHNIRQQQAQLNSLESIVRSSPRPFPAEYTSNNFTMASTSSNPIDITPTKVKRRSSRDILLSLAGPDSNLPLPVRESEEDNSIREGIPSTSPTHFKRPLSPSRTLSRIPISAVGNARALADEGIGTPSRPAPKLTSLDPVDSSSSSLVPPTPSPNKRLSFTPSGTTKVLADLQTGVVNARNALENTKQQLRLSQRSVAQLTRQTEDLKESRERLRLENEGLNNVVARKERLLQEVLDRARKAEAEASTLRGQLKTETTTSKKAIREMEASLSESTALSQKSEREYITLRDGIKSMAESWKQDMDRLQQEMKKREDKLVAEAQRMGKMYKDLVDQLQKKNEHQVLVTKLKEENEQHTKEIEAYWTRQIEELKAEVVRENKNSEDASQTARHLAEELARLRRLMQSAGRAASTDDSPAASQTPNLPP